MADFDTPFGSDAERRLASSLEKLNGFPCGAAEQALFNGLFWQLQSELVAIHAEAGIVGDDSTSRTTVDAILALIAAAVGSTPEGYVLMTQARGRLPIFPDVQNTDGRIVVTSPSAGTVRIPGGVEFMHRGIFPVTTAQTDFATAASKIYHLRWDPTNGYRLIDTGDSGYNPSSLAETNAAFDTTYDDMLIARVVTNSSNVATITNLANKDRLMTTLSASASMSAPSTNGATGTATISYDLARKPAIMPYRSSVGVTGTPSDPSGEIQASQKHDHDESISVVSTRYSATITSMRDYAAAMTLAGLVIMGASA